MVWNMTPLLGIRSPGIGAKNAIDGDVKILGMVWFVYHQQQQYHLGLLEMQNIEFHPQTA